MELCEEDRVALVEVQIFRVVQQACLAQDVLREDLLSSDRYRVCESWAQELTTWESLSSALLQ